MNGLNREYGKVYGCARCLSDLSCPENHLPNNDEIEKKLDKIIKLLKRKGVKNG